MQRVLWFKGIPPFLVCKEVIPHGRLTELKGGGRAWIGGQKDIRSLWSEDLLLGPEMTSVAKVMFYEWSAKARELNRSFNLQRDRGTGGGDCLPAGFAQAVASAWFAVAQGDVSALALANTTLKSWYDHQPQFVGMRAI